MVIALSAALALAGCGNKIETRTVGETEGLYIDIGGLKYQVQISRIINPNDIEDRHYLQGLPSDAAAEADEAWFGVWVQVQNTTSEGTFDTATDFEIVDTQENSFQPIGLEDNVFAYAPERLGPNSVLPNSESPPGQGPIQGSLLLFKLTARRCRTGPSSSRSRAPTIPRTSGSSTSTSSQRSLDHGLGRRAAVSPPAPWPTSSTATATFGFA